MDKLLLKWNLNGVEFAENFKPYSKSELSNWFNINLFDELYYLDKNDSHLNYGNRNSVSDFILDASTTYSIQKYVSENIEKRADERSVILINGILIANYFIQRWIEILKIDLSILLNSSACIMEDDQKIIELVDLLSLYKTQYGIHNESIIDKVFNDIITFDLDMFNSKLKELFKEAIEWIVLLNTTSNISVKQKKRIFRHIDNLIIKIPSCVDENCKFLYLRIRMLINHVRLQNKFDSISCVKMVLSQIEFEYAREELVSQTVEKMSYIQNMTMTYVQRDEMNDDLLIDNNLFKLENFFKNNRFLDQKGNESIINEVSDYYNNNRGCFGILETPIGCYFALSGYRDYIGAKKADLSTNKEIEELAVKINSTLFNDTYTWARLTDDTLRYINADYDRKKRNLERLPNPIKLGDDIEVISKDKVGFHYACCERKMQAYCNNWKINKIYYSRWSPCEKCIPSFNYESGDVKVYALSENFSTWEHDRISNLIECKIEKTLTISKFV